MRRVTSLSGLLCFLILLLGGTASAQLTVPFSAKFTAAQLVGAPARLIPFPRQFEWDGKYIPVADLKLSGAGSPSPNIRVELIEILESAGNYLSASAALTGDFVTDTTYEREAYALDISDTGIVFTAATEAGHFYALQTFRQLIQDREGTTSIPVCRIDDAPAFPVRGFMIDVGRNFQSLESLKRQLDIMASYKLNVFQWHLTDRPAWRVESRVYPALTASGKHRSTRDPGKFYTYDDIRELIAYAKDRHISIIPEIDMPGHSDSFTKAMGFKMESEEGMAALEAILTEFFAEIPREDCPIIHLGSDEVRIQNPEEFMDRMVGFCHANDREVMIWNPGLEVSSNVIRQTWRSPAPPAKPGDRVVDSWNSYINNGEPMTQVQRLFFKPIGYASKDEVIGGILCLWPDVNLEREADAFTQNPVYPSMLTYAWATWTADISSAPPAYYMTLPPRDSMAYTYFSAFEDILLHHKNQHFSDLPFQYLAQTDKSWRLIGPFDGDEADEPLRQIKDAYTVADSQYVWKKGSGNTLVINDRFRLGGYFPDATAGQTVYALTYIHADRDRKVPTWVGFESPMRANRTYTGIAQLGEWDPNGGTIWINDTPLPAPVWENPGWKPANQNGWASPAELEMPWTKEELYWTRPPTQIPLRKGWNKVLAKIPASSSYQNWMFTFAPLSTEGIVFADRPAAHSTYYYQKKTLFESLPNTEGEIILIGDSMTDGGEWSELFGDSRVKNRGISADVTIGVLDRLEEATESAPAKIFILIGTNDLARGSSPAEVIKNISRIVTGINEKSPPTEVFVQSIFPVNDHYGMFGGHTDKGDQIQTVNAALERGLGGNYTYLDLYSAFTDGDQKLNIAYSNDGLHLNGEGYLLWASVLKEFMK